MAEAKSKVDDKSTEKEIVAIDDIGSEQKLLDLINNKVPNIRRWDLVTGKVVRIDKDQVLVDLGYKTEGIIPQKELSIKTNIDPADIVSLGEEIETLVTDKEDRQGRLMLSRKGAQIKRAWKQLAEKRQSKDKVIGEVIDVVKGGLIVDVGVRAFLPASLVDIYKPLDLEPYRGQTIEVRVLEIDQAKSNVILSRKAWLEENLNEKKEKFFKTVEVGQVRKGKVSSIVTFGAFVDLGEGVDGLVHSSQISWKHINHPSDVLQLGQEVQAEVIEVDQENKKVSLSIKSTTENPYLAYAKTHMIGQIVEGTVSKITRFGAFVDLTPDVEGLIHISELSFKQVLEVEHVLHRGDEVFAKILDIDLERRTIALSLRQANNLVDLTSEEFDPSLYGMVAEYDEKGNYKFPEGFNPETNEWMPGFEEQRANWEKEYRHVHSLWTKHREQVKKFLEMEEQPTKSKKISKQAKVESTPADQANVPTDVQGDVAPQESTPDQGDEKAAAQNKDSSNESE